MHRSLHCKASASTPGRAAGQAGPVRPRFTSRSLHTSCSAHFGGAASNDATRQNSETPSSSPRSCPDPLPRSADALAASRRAALLALGALSVPLASPSTATAAAEAALDAPSTSGREAVDTTITHLVGLPCVPQWTAMGAGGMGAWGHAQCKAKGTYLRPGTFADASLAPVDVLRLWPP